MKIIFYHSNLCPRCHRTRKILNELAREQQYKDLHIEQVDILHHPLRAIQDGVLMIPTLLREKKRLATILPSKEKIAAFLQDGEEH